MLPPTQIWNPKSKICIRSHPNICSFLTRDPESLIQNLNQLTHTPHMLTQCSVLSSRAHRSEIPNLEFSTLHISGCNRLELRRFPLNKPLILWWQSPHYLCTLSIPWFESHVPLSNYLESHTHTHRVTRMLSYTISKGRRKWGTVHILCPNASTQQ